MKNLVKLFGIIALVSVIGLSMTACDDSGDGDGSTPTPDPRYVYSAANTSTFTLRFADGLTDGLTDKNGTVSAIVINSVDWGGNNYTAETTFTYSVSGTTITIKFSITEWNNTGLPVRYTMYEIGRLSNEAVSNPTGFSNVETLTFTKSGENLTGTNCTFTYKPNK